MLRPREPLCLSNRPLEVGFRCVARGTAGRCRLPRAAWFRDLQTPVARRACGQRLAKPRLPGCAHGHTFTSVLTRGAFSRWTGRGRRRAEGRAVQRGLGRDSMPTCPCADVLRVAVSQRQPVLMTGFCFTQVDGNVPLVQPGFECLLCSRRGAWLQPAAGHGHVHRVVTCRPWLLGVREVSQNDPLTRRSVTGRDSSSGPGSRGGRAR